MRRNIIVALTIMVAMEGAWADERVETIFIQSGDESIPSREVRVWLPPGYDEGDARYPVVYFHDGQNVFRPGGLFGCWFAEDAAAEDQAF